MCGRLVVAQPRDVVAELVAADEVVAPELPLSWNVAPSAELYALARVGAARRLGAMRWGLLPWWAPDPGTARRPINARAETMAEVRHFAESLARRRCLVVADGFYEWERGPDGTKHPWYFTRTDGGPLVLAALWDRWRPRDDPAPSPVVSCAIVTTAANADMAGLHDRMPVVLEPGEWDAWLDPEAWGPAEAARRSAAGAAGRLTARRANRLANSTANDGPELLSA